MLGRFPSSSIVTFVACGFTFFAAFIIASFFASAFASLLYSAVASTAAFF
ncbi:hypothetical protein ACV3P8_17130 [Clostridium perfringens]